MSTYLVPWLRRLHGPGQLKISSSFPKLANPSNSYRLRHWLYRQYGRHYQNLWDPHSPWSLNSGSHGDQISSPDLHVVVLAGDGGAYGEGLNHLATAVRANIDIKVLVCDNHLYSLTTGQTSPTTPRGVKTKSTPQGNTLIPIDPVNFAKSLNPQVTVDQASTKDPTGLSQKVIATLQSTSFALLNIDQECVTFGGQLNNRI